MSVLVTGAFGCIGAWVVRGLLAEGERPVVFDLGDDPWRLRMIVAPTWPAGSPSSGATSPIANGSPGSSATTRSDRSSISPPGRSRSAARTRRGGALINVVGTANVFEAARAAAGQIERIVYASSAAVFGPPNLYPPGPIKDDAPPHPATHYGVYKVANEETARIYWEEHKIPSMGFRPLSVYGPGRDFGLTADRTLAMKSAVLGRPFQIRWGGRTDLVYTDDVARAFIVASRSGLPGARVYNLHGSSAAVADVARLITEARPQAKGSLSHVEQPIPFPDALDDARYQRDLGPAPRTPLEAGVRRTLEEFARLQKEGRLDARELP